MSTNGFRGVYLEDLGFPIVLIGLVMGFSRIVWRGMSKFVHIIERKVSLYKLMIFEIFLYSCSLLGAAIISNPYIVGGIFALVSGYQRARNPIITNFIIKNLEDKKYKATVLSIQSQMSAIISFSLMFVLGFIMEVSYFWGFIGAGIIALVLLSTMFLLSHKSGSYHSL